MTTAMTRRPAKRPTPTPMLIGIALLLPPSVEVDADEEAASLVVVDTIGALLLEGATEEGVDRRFFELVIVASSLASADTVAESQPFPSYTSCFHQWRYPTCDAFQRRTSQIRQSITSRTISFRLYHLSVQLNQCWHPPHQHPCHRDWTGAWKWRSCAAAGRHVVTQTVLSIAFHADTAK